MKINVDKRRTGKTTKMTRELLKGILNGDEVYMAVLNENSKGYVLDNLIQYLVKKVKERLITHRELDSNKLRGKNNSKIFIDDLETYLQSRLDTHEVEMVNITGEYYDDK